MVTKETILGGMDKREFKFRKVLEPVTATTDGILVRVLRHQPFYAVRKFLPGFYCFYYLLFSGRSKGCVRFINLYIVLVHEKL